MVVEKTFLNPETALEIRLKSTDSKDNSLSRILVVALVASSLDAVVVLSIQSVGGLGCGAGSVREVWALNGLGGGWNGVASIYKLCVIESQEDQSLPSGSVFPAGVSQS